MRSAHELPPVSLPVVDLTGRKERSLGRDLKPGREALQVWHERREWSARQSASEQGRSLLAVRAAVGRQAGPSLARRRSRQPAARCPLPLARSSTASGDVHDRPRRKEVVCAQGRGSLQGATSTVLARQPSQQTDRLAARAPGSSEVSRPAPDRPRIGGRAGWRPRPSRALYSFRPLSNRW